MSEQKTCSGGEGVEEATIVVSGENKPCILTFLQQNFIELLSSTIPHNTTARNESELTVSDLLFCIQENIYFLGNSTTK